MKTEHAPIISKALLKHPNDIPGSSSREAPGLRRGLLDTAVGNLPADLDARTNGARAAVVGAFTVGDNLHPERILALIVRGRTGLAQRSQAVLRRTRGCGGESRQVEDHPRAAIQFAEAQVHGLPLGGHLDLGTGSYVGAGQVVFL